jgi:dihydrofolate reductase
MHSHAARATGSRFGVKGVSVRKLIMWNLITLDGHFEGANKWDLDWHELAWGDELHRFSLEQLASADLLLFGRVTYEGMAAHWPSAKGPIADAMNRLPKVVCSRTLPTAGWNNTTLLHDDIARQVAGLKEQGDGNMLVFGSGVLSRTLMNEGLFDEYRLALVPIVLGGGTPLFAPAGKPRRLLLRTSKALANGCLVLSYAPAAAA